MWRYKVTYGGGGWHYATQEQWLDALLNGLFRSKAPLSWVQQQIAAGRSSIAAFSIWAKYPIDRKATAWMLATEDDARAAGYME